MSKAKKPENSLLNALQFVSVAQVKRSAIAAETHCRLWGKQLSATTAILSAGIAIQEEIECCPDSAKLIEALKECPEAVNLTLLPTKELSVKSGNFQATIPCIEHYDIPAIFPDPRTLAVEPEFELALHKVASVANEKAKQVAFSSVWLRDGSIAATNGDVIIEAWHGCPSPVGAIVPKLWCNALKKSKGKTLYRLGAGDRSLTAHYEDGSWIKTRLHDDPNFPNITAWLNLPCEPIPVPLGFWAAVERLAPFSNDGRLYFRREGICTDQYQTDGAINLCDGLPVGISFSIQALQLIAPFAEKFAFNVTNSMAYFFGNKIRGAIGQKGL